MSRSLYLPASRKSALTACLVTSSCGVQPTGDSFWLKRKYSIDGSPVRSSMSLFVTVSIHVTLMDERRCRIMNACRLFTCRLYTVQDSATYMRVDSTIARYILPLTRMDTWWLFDSLWRSRPKDVLALAILLCMHRQCIH